METKQPKMAREDIILVNLTEVAYDVLDSFTSEFFKKVKEIKACGALSDGVTEYEIYKYALILTAEQFKPISEHGKKELANLRHFV